MANLQQSASPSLLEAGQIIPAFTLPGTDNTTYSPWDYKQRRSLVLVFVNSSQESHARNLLREFAVQAGNFLEENCVILAITPDTVEENRQTQEALHLPYALLSDTQERVMPRYTSRNQQGTRSHPCIVLTDRYGALYQQWIAQDEAQLPPIRELLESLQYLNSLCTP